MMNDYAQYDRNCKLSFALASMAFEPYTHVIVRQRLPGEGLQTIGGGYVSDLLSRFGDLQVESSYITHEGLLQITVSSPDQ